MPKTDILIAGVGGQGTILAGNIISAVALAAGLDVKTAETHGMAQRGGSVITHVRLGDKVYSPLIPRGDADFLLSFEQLEALRWLPYLAAGGTVIVNTQVLEPLPVLTGEQGYPGGILEEIRVKAAKTIAVAALESEPVKTNPRTLNIFLLGLLARFLPFPREKWEHTIEQLVPARYLEINHRAFAAGYHEQLTPEARGKGMRHRY